MSKLDKILEAIENKESNVIQNSSFVGVQYDAKAVEAINLIATGLIENAKALANLTEVLKASNTTIESMVKIESK
nr:MAG TPA: hypothetical protein [Caudoviricetes sp.]